ncbi:hypothetical protein ACFWUW_26710 [Streptomyces sp. NPDC058655]
MSWRVYVGPVRRTEARTAAPLGGLVGDRTIEEATPMGEGYA